MVDCTLQIRTRRKVAIAREHKGWTQCSGERRHLAWAKLSEGGLDCIGVIRSNLPQPLVFAAMCRLEIGPPKRSSAFNSYIVEACKRKPSSNLKRTGAICNNLP